MTQCFILNDTRSEKHHGCETVMTNLLKGLGQRGLKVQSLPTGRYIKDHISYQDAFEQAKIIIINGEGTLHSGRPYARYLLDCGELAKKQGKQVWLINSTWENNPEEMLCQIATFDGVWVRDKNSLKTIKDKVTNANYSPDLTFAFPHQTQAKNINKPPKILVTDSIFAHLSDQLCAFTQKNKQEYKYLPIIRPLSTDRSLLTFDAKKMRKFNFYQLLSLLTFRLYQPRRYYQDLTIALDQPQQFWQNMLESSAIISARYHAVCFSLQLQIPFVALDSNTRKVRSLLEDIGLNVNQRIISIDQLNQYSPIQIKMLSNYDASELANLKKFLIFAQQRNQLMLDQISGALNISHST